MNKFDRITRKITYKGLSKDQKNCVKIWESLNLLERYFYAPITGFYKNAPRLESGQVDWNSLDKRDLDLFDNNFKRQQSLMKARAKFNEAYYNEAIDMFHAINNKSVSF